ncbi:MAG: DUF2726 domain-containing protein [Anaerolineales bacterium]|nr:DUF2726 domain-containing protein [Anaerolineales bacterium]
MALDQLHDCAIGAWLEGKSLSEAPEDTIPPDGEQVVAEPTFDLQTAERPRYAKRRSLLTNTEAVLFETLQKVTGSDYQVFPMVRLGDVMRLQNLPADRKYHNNQIMCKHFDFVLC